MHAFFHTTASATATVTVYWWEKKYIHVLQNFNIDNPLLWCNKLSHDTQKNYYQNEWIN